MVKISLTYKTAFLILHPTKKKFLSKIKKILDLFFLKSGGGGIKVSCLV